MYERELMEDVIHNSAVMCEEIWVPNRKIIIRKYGSMFIIGEADRPQTEEKVINSLTNRVGKYAIFVRYKCLMNLLMQQLHIKRQKKHWPQLYLHLKNKQK